MVLQNKGLDLWFFLNGSMHEDVGEKLAWDSTSWKNYLSLSLSFNYCAFLMVFPNNHSSCVFYFSILLTHFYQNPFFLFLPFTILVFQRWPKCSYPNICSIYGIFALFLSIFILGSDSTSFTKILSYNMHTCTLLYIYRWRMQDTYLSIGQFFGWSF